MSKQDRRVFIAVVALIALAAALWINHRDSYANPWDHNEGVYLNSARLVANGEPLFTRVFSSQPPVFLTLLAQHFRAFGDSAGSGRIFMAAWGVVALGAMAFLAWRLLGPACAPWVVLLAATSYLFSRAGHFTEAEMPAVALALVSMVLCLEATHRNSTVLAIAAGVVFGLGLMTKVLVLPWLAAAGVLLLPVAAGATVRFGGLLDASFWKRGAMFAFGLVSVSGLLFLVFDTSEMWRQAFYFHLDKRGSAGEASPYLPNLLQMARYLPRDAGILVLAIVGLGVMTLRNGFALCWLLVLAGSSVAFLSVHTPMAANHVLLLSVCTAFFAAVGAASLAGLLARKMPSVIAIGLVAFLSQVCIESSGAGIPLGKGNAVLTLNPVRNQAKFLEVQIPTQDRQIMEFLRANTAPNEAVVSDGHKAVFWAGRASPPFLCDVTHERVVSGWMRDEDLITHSEGVSTIVVQTGQLDRFPLFVQWVQQNYTVAAEIPGETRTATIWRKAGEGER